MTQSNSSEISAMLQEADDTKWDYADVQARFEAVAAPTYGDSMPKWIPDYVYTNRLMLDTMRHYLPAGGRAADLGAGTGRFSKQILDTFDDCHLTVLDFSANMLAEAPNKLRGHEGRFETIVADFFDESVEFPEASFDCIASVFAVCHGRGVEKYRNLYGRIERWLKPGGCFVCYDHVVGDAQPFTVMNVAGWREFMRPMLSAEQIEEAIVSTYQEDSPLSLRQHLELLSEVGFVSADVLYKKDIFAIYAGVKGK